MSSVLWRCRLGVRKSIRSVNIDWWGVGVVFCLQRGVDCLHVVQLMPLHPKTPSSLASFKSIDLTRMSWERGCRSSTNSSSSSRDSWMSCVCPHSTSSLFSIYFLPSLALLLLFRGERQSWTAWLFSEIQAIPTHENFYVSKTNPPPTSGNIILLNYLLITRSTKIALSIGLCWCVCWA